MRRTSGAGACWQRITPCMGVFATVSSATARPKTRTLIRWLGLAETETAALRMRKWQQADVRSWGLPTAAVNPKGRIRLMGSGHEFQSPTKTILVTGTNPLAVNGTWAV